MHLAMFARWALALTMAPALATAMGILSSPFKRELKLMAEMGLDPDVLLSQKGSVHAIADNLTDEVIAEYASIPIDHTDSSVGTYKNRFWVQDKYYVEGGPVFVYDVGESNAESSAKLQLGNETSFFASMLQEHSAMGVVWEHRYYGDSLPFPITNNTPPEHWIYLTNAQALADIPYFAQNFTRPTYKNVELVPSATPWVMVGGSYSGMRAAFTRHNYPETIFASYASSAPVQARVDMSVYFDQVYDGMVANGHLNCTKDIKAAMEYIDAELSKNSSSSAAIKKQFFGTGAEKNSRGDFTAAIAGIFGYFQAYGLGGGDGSLGSFCEHLETDNETLTIAGANGFAPYKGKEYVVKRFASWPIFIDLINFNYETNCDHRDKNQTSSCVLNPKSPDADTISWTWQFCTEWGYYQSNNIGPHSLLSRYQSLEYMQYTCNRQFPEAVKSGLLPKRPLVEATNNQTGGWTIRPSNVYWSGGQFDPWRTLSPLATESIAPQSVSFTTEIPKCNVETAEDTVFGYIMPNAEHCFDFHMNFAPGKISRGYFHKALNEWLPCFNGTATNAGRGQ